MITHVVVFKLNDDTTPDQADEMLRRLQELPSLIPGLDQYHPGRDLGLRPGNGEIALVARFESPEAFFEYAKHPAHVAFLDECVTPWATRLGAQY